MKAIKRLFAVMLALIIGTATATAASAADGTITINNTTDGATYSVYKIADLVEYNKGTGVYEYQVKGGGEWHLFLLSVANEYGIKLTQEDNGNYRVSWPGEPSAETVQSFAKEAIEFAEGANILPEATDVAEGDTLEFSGLELGWYLVDSSAGALVSLTTTDPNAEVNDKNNTPSITKQVWEDYTGGDYTSEWVDKATIDTTDTISYQLTVDVGRVASDDYDITDELAEFIAEDLSALSQAGVAAFYQSLRNTVSVVGLDSEKNEVSLGNGWSFDYDVNVTDEFYITLSEDVLSDESLDLARVIITYSIEPSYYGDAATAFTNMTVGEIYNAGVTLEYNELEYTDYAGVVTYKGGPGIYKVDENSEALKGVGFTLAKVVDDTTTLYAQVNSNNVVTAWVSDESSATTIYTDANGNLRVDGLDADEYIWTEVAPLYGYANISYTVTMWIDLDGKVTYSETDSEKTPGPEITVVNVDYGELPGTGGMGTTIFYIVGTILVAGALVGFLVVRLRKNSEKATAIA